MVPEISVLSDKMSLFNIASTKYFINSPNTKNEYITSTQFYNTNIKIKLQKINKILKLFIASKVLKSF